MSAFLIGAAFMAALAIGGAWVGDPTRPTQIGPWQTEWKAESK